MHATENLQKRNFGLLLAGQSISLLGDQFYILALPWLVLLLSGTPGDVAATLALAGVPRAIFMLAGGVLVDRFSPQRVLFLSNVARMLLVTYLAVVLITSHTSLNEIYLLAFLFGLADAFVIPAQNSFLPTILPAEKLKRANVMMGLVTQLSFFLGPLGAAVCIGYSAGRPGAGMTPHAFGVAMLVDAMSFLFSLGTLLLIKVPPRTLMPVAQRFGSSLMDGLRYAVGEKTLRLIIGAIAITNLFVVGPLLLGLPIIAKEKFGQILSYGGLMSGLGLGNMVGMIAAGWLFKARKKIGVPLMLITSLMAFAMAGLDVLINFWATLALILAIGFINGIISVLFFSWLQCNVRPEMMGRVISLVMFFSIGMFPIAAILFGPLLAHGRLLSFAIAGIATGSILLALSFHRSIKEMVV